MRSTQQSSLANRAQERHQWHPAFPLGEQVRVICGALASCPFCLSRSPGSTRRLILCALHHQERRVQT